MILASRVGSSPTQNSIESADLQWKVHADRGFDVVEDHGVDDGGR
jgi:hypothetical protein